MTEFWSQEYWAHKGDVKLYMFRKRLGAPQPGEAPEAARLRLEAYTAAGLALFHDFLRVAGALSLLAVAPAILMRKDRAPKSAD